MPHHVTVKHRATEPVRNVDRPVNAGSHRRYRTSDLPIAAALGIILIIVAAILATRG